MNEQKKSIITVIGKDSVGIIAKVCTYLAENDINILDISQTITGGYFNMMMIVESAEVKKSFPEMAADLRDLGEQIGVVIQAQHEEIFQMMHRI
ncbi:MAG: ACT domain-containing protein [Eubacterium sp.]|nr:ACT domain-containing protein [Eubacterium sp.]